MPLVLRPSKQNKGYIHKDVLGAVRQRFVSKYGDIGQIWYFLTNFEVAAIDAIRAVFPETKVEGCTVPLEIGSHASCRQ